MIIIIIAISFLLGYYGFAFIEKLSEDEVNDKLPDPTDPDVVIPPEPEPCSGSDCEPTLPPIEPKPDPSTPNIICTEPKGDFVQLWVRHDNAVTSNVETFFKNKPEIVGEFLYTGNCPTSVYIEAGIINKPNSFILAFIPGIRSNIDILGEPSTCDGNKHFSGVVVNVQPQQRVVFLLKPENYGVEAVYPIDIGVYTGCLKDGGKTIAYRKAEVAFSDKFSAYEIDNSWYGG